MHSLRLYSVGVVCLGRPANMRFRADHGILALRFTIEKPLVKPFYHLPNRSDLTQWPGGGPGDLPTGRQTWRSEFELK